ncbi:MAG: hypothetical protein OQL20_02870 [Sedimenticola sp.]|nr:hypothetical protein [Sedimenticola sp.]
MKFSQLKIGDRFVFKGTEFTKSGPLQAVELATGSEKTIMRAAPVALASDSTQKLNAPNTGYDKLEALIRRYHNVSMEQVAGQEEDNKREQLEALFVQILQALKGVKD